MLMLSSIHGDAIYDSIAIYSHNYYIDLCFRNTKILDIRSNDRRYPVNAFSGLATREIVDSLSWRKDYNEGLEKNNWDLRIS